MERTTSIDALVITIPEDMVLISKVEYEEMKHKELSEVYWNMKDLEERTYKKHEWLKENVLYPQKFRKVLDVKNGGFVYYPDSKGKT
ncbi:DUF771 domain-containing protein [Alkalihalobacillus sp. MEB203]|uniref:DUF771 domain-containing protein n=1 Tax=Alkalihalobacterium chitinilyticum TaxID=2980103 RepID=A0ABT5VFF8_9BACI|nr:DUF771 domain-containing protein [Alkalihalobacterium chitinilyticum]MDE5414186.1 DUF771 domain-containing protein [Alkalihalobacterium chitinilyticum]